ncbi:PREDICTED: probable ATP-dependent RNA helicase DDX4 isoform X3 [Lepidothrix coronata]|uniref:RNA helicase n=1 Tax=Lepidothrix coronata TaxID=321398 RepID=A0A6J0GZ23_9PASS|nr:PREDICTED: probable ATP-dependent RNA helicase DDX4 isoform X3 [Lepidothrix coronata]
MGDEALLPSLEKVSLFERPNDLSSGFSPSVSSFGTDEFLNRQCQPMSSFGRGRNFAAKGFQERNIEDASMQNRGSKGFSGGFGQGKRLLICTCRIVKLSCCLLCCTPGFQGRNAAEGSSMHTKNKGFKGFHGDFGQCENRQRNMSQSGILDSTGKGTFTDGAGFQERNVVKGFSTRNRGSKGFHDSFGQGPKVTYVPPPPPDDEQAIFARYETGMNFDKYDENIVEVSGLDPPAALMSFADANISHTLTVNIAKAGYSKPTPVQKYSIPIVLAGRDLMACAQTGSGKTAAFLVPIVAQMMRDGVTASSFKQQQEPECIITGPTRELVNQIFLEARKFVYGTCIRPVVVYGGTQIGHSVHQVMQGCNILCATPGRLLDIIGRGKISLHNVKYLVLDEADRMLDMGFGSEMKKLISFPDMPQKDKRQTLMFSATFPEEVQRLAGEFLKTDFLFVVVGHVGGACSDVQQNILQVSQYLKRDKLMEILRSTGNERTMVFVDTKKKADFIACFLCQENIPATSIHGDREQREREIALQDFRSGKCPVLVATSVAARGLDIESVQNVINFDLPSTIEEYVHRIGRTGRCGNTGKAVCFFDNDSDGHLAQSLIKVLSDAQQEVPLWLTEVAFESERGRLSVNVRKHFVPVVTEKEMFSTLIWMFVLLYSSVADENSIRDADIFPSSAEIKRGSSLKRFCILGKHHMPHRNASHIIWKLNDELIAPENYNIVNETVSSITIPNFTYSTAYLECFMKYLDKEQLLVHKEFKSGFPPDTPENISCIYYFDDNLTCTWNSGRKTSFTRNYTLYRKLVTNPNTIVSSCQSKTESCSFLYPDTPYSSAFCFQVKAENVLGEALSKCVPIAMGKIEKFDPPEILLVKTISGIKQLLTVTWKMPEKIVPSQDLTCQVQYRNLYSNSTKYVTVPLNSAEKTGSCNLTGLWDSTEYSVAVRCISNESIFWSEWSGEKSGSTKEKAPLEKVDLWRVIESSHSPGSRFVHLMWKPLNSFPPSGRILGYKIQYFPENKTELKMINNSTDKKITLLLNEEAHIVSVTAYNSAGNSPEAILRIPSTDEKTAQINGTARTLPSNEEVVVEWVVSKPEATEYVVEWFEDLEMDPFSRSWQYVSNSTNWKTNKKNFKPFVCYNISVYPLYGNKVAAPYTVQTYVQQKKPSEGPVADTGIPGKNEVTIKWNKISKDKRNGFITNYTIFYKPEDGKELNETVNSNARQYRLKSLQANTQYTVYIMASNEAGGTTGEPKTFKTLKLDKEDVILIALLVGISVFCLLGLWVTCILKKHVFKKVCWPDIPNPAESIAVEWPLAASMNNSLLKKLASEAKTVDFEDISVLEHCFPEENHVSECIDINAEDMINGDKKILHKQENDVAKCFLPSMSYVITDQFTRSQMKSTLILVKEIQPMEMLANDLCGSQQNSIKNEENDEVLKVEDFNEKTLFNPYLKNSVKTREFLISESLPEHNMDECKSQSSVLPPFQQNVAGQPYITLDMFEPATAQ